MVQKNRGDTPSVVGRLQEAAAKEQEQRKSKEEEQQRTRDDDERKKEERQMELSQQDGEIEVSGRPLRQVQ